MQFQRGQRLSLAQLTPLRQLTVEVEVPLGRAVDISVFGLDAQRRLSDDRYFIFYNQQESPERALRITGAPSAHRQQFAVALDRLPPTIEVLTIAATSDGASFRDLSRGHLTLRAGGREVARFDLDGCMFAAEQAVIIAELYLRQGEWRVAAIAQGFDGGLRALLESFGGVVADEPEHTPEPTEVQGPPTPEAEKWPPLRSVPRPAPTAGHCAQCGKAPSLLNRLDPKTQRCRDCKASVQRGLERFRNVFVTACADGVMTREEWQGLQGVITQEGLDVMEALAFVRADAVTFIERVVVLARADGELSPQEETEFNQLRQLLQVPDHMIATPLHEMAELKHVTRLRRGDLPTFPSAMLLDSDEICHLDLPATHRQITAHGVRNVEGHVILTSKQMHFAGLEGGWTVKFANVLRVEEVTEGVNLSLSVKKGSGLYAVSHPMVLAATLNALVRLHKRLMLMPQTERATRHIPQDVKRQVFQRDQGKCRQCGSRVHLEFDHEIPHSKGGANTVNNVQLLCRSCNLAKGDRIY